MKPKDNNITPNNFKKFPKKITNKNKTKKYELLDAVSETGDSNYTLTPNSHIKVKPEGQFYLRVDILEELCDQIKSIQKCLALLCKDLVKAGVLKEV